MPDFMVTDPGSAGDLTHGVPGIDIINHSPIICGQIDIPDTASRSVDKLESHIQAGNFFLEVFRLAPVA